MLLEFYIDIDDFFFMNILLKFCVQLFYNMLIKNCCVNYYVMRIRIIFSLPVMQFQTFLELSYNL